MDNLHQRFDEIVAKIKELPAGAAAPSNELKLALYGLFRQARDGDAHGEPPSLFDFVARMKYNAWTRNAGMAADEAMRQYIQLAEDHARANDVEL